MEAENMTIEAARRLLGKGLYRQNQQISAFRGAGMRAALTVPGFHREKEPTILINVLKGKHSVQ